MRGERSGGVVVASEEEIARGWLYEVTIAWPGDGESVTSHSVTLSWSDHDYWSGGSAEPSRVVEAVLRVLAERLDRESLRLPGVEPGALPRRFDASLCRRLVSDIDEALRVL